MAVKTKKKPSIKTLKRKLDEIFSIYIRLRDSNSNGIIMCYCCGKPLPWRKSENMHFIPRQHMSLRFNEVNCHAGCTRCNHYLNGNIEMYTLNLQKEYGEDIVEKLTIARNQTNKMSVFEYQVMINFYKKKVQEELKKKGLSL